MTLQRFLDKIYYEKCIFQVSSNEVKDIELGVLQFVNKVLNKGSTMNVDTDSNVTFQDLFLVDGISPVGSFYEGTKIHLPDEFDFNVRVEVGKIDIFEGCRPGRVGVKFENKKQDDVSKLFPKMLNASFNSFTDEEKIIRQGSGILSIKSIQNTIIGVPYIEMEWAGKSRTFAVTADIMMTITCNQKFLQEMENEEHFPTDFIDLFRQKGACLVPKSCSRDCQKCFHVSFVQEELYLMQNLNEDHSKCYQVLKWLLTDRILDSYKIKTAILHHVYIDKCKCTEGYQECVLSVLTFLFDKYEKLRMQPFFMSSCCIITKDGEGKARYLDYLIDAKGLDMSTIPAMDTSYTDFHTYSMYSWIDMFVWYEFQKRCLNLITKILKSYLINEIATVSEYERFFKSLVLIHNTEICEISGGDVTGRPTSVGEWRNNISNFSERLFIPAFSMLLDKVTVILNKEFNFHDIPLKPPIPLCLPDGIIGFSQGDIGSFMTKQDGKLLRGGADCYFGFLKNGFWLPLAFGKMSFVEDAKISFERYVSRMLRRVEKNINVHLVNIESTKEIEDFQGPFEYNAVYDGQGFMEEIASSWYYRQLLISFLIARMLVAISIFYQK